MSVTPLKGEILYRWEPPDTGFVTYIGYISGDDMRRLIELSAPFGVGKRYTFVLVDLSRLGSVSREAREISRSMSRKGTSAPHRGTAIFGASFHFRALANIGIRAFNLLTGQTDNPTRFFDTETAARGWLAERRDQLRAAGIHPDL